MLDDGAYQGVQVKNSPTKSEGANSGRGMISAHFQNKCPDQPQSSWSKTPWRSDRLWPRVQAPYSADSLQILIAECRCWQNFGSSHGSRLLCPQIGLRCTLDVLRCWNLGLSEGVKVLKFKTNNALTRKDTRLKCLNACFCTIFAVSLPYIHFYEQVNEGS